MTAIVGISTACDASSAAVVVENDQSNENRGGNPIASAIEQFKIREHARSTDGAPLPEEAIRTSLEIAGVDASHVGLIAIIGDVESTEQLVPHIRRLGLNVRATIEPVDHRAAHAAAAFYSSPFDRAAIIIPGGTVGRHLPRCWPWRPNRDRRNTGTILRTQDLVRPDFQRTGFSSQVLQQGGVAWSRR